MLYRARRVPSSASPHERTSTALKGFEEAYRYPTHHSRFGMTEHMLRCGDPSEQGPAIVPARLCFRTRQTERRCLFHFGML